MCKTCYKNSLNCITCFNNYDLTNNGKCIQRTSVSLIVKLNGAIEEYYKVANSVKLTLVSYLGTKYKNQVQYFMLGGLKSGSIILNATVGIP